MKLAMGLLLLAAAPVQAADLTIKTGETWIFAVQDNQPASAHKAAANASLRKARCAPPLAPLAERR
jgi:hypothetical protein